MADAYKSWRKYVQQEAAQELIHAQRHQTFLVLMGGVAPAERNHAAGECDETVVGDRHAMGVLTEITKRLLRPSKGALGINHPFGTEQRTQPRRENLRIVQRGERSVKAEFMLCMQLFEAIDELAPKYLTEHLDRQEELSLRGDPLRVIGGETAGGNNAVHMGMMLQFLIPGVEDAEEADLCAKTFGIARDLKQCLSTGPE